VQLGTLLQDDPLQRLALIHAQTSGAESSTPAAAPALAGRLFGRSSLDGVPGLPGTACTITPVPGPRVPLYLNGARMTYFSAILPIADGMGLVFAVTHYDGRIVISPTSAAN
jgi:diacylglycerol O-acyltransferase